MEDRIWRHMLTTKTNSIVGTNYRAGPGFITLLLSKVSPGLNSSILGSYFETVKLYLFIS